MSVDCTIRNGLAAVALHSPDGAKAVVTLHGGHVVSWIPAGSNDEQLYLSPTSVFGGGMAIRGGVPVVFPQFSDRGPLVRHGFARTRTWKLLNSGVDAQGAIARLRLSDDDATRALWPNAFDLDLVVRVEGNGLSMELACHNTGNAPVAFTCALHTYLRVRDVAQVHVSGLAGPPYRNAVDGTYSNQSDEQLRVYGALAHLSQLAVVFLGIGLFCARK